MPKAGGAGTRSSVRAAVKAALEAEKRQKEKTETIGGDAADATRRGDGTAGVEVG